ncbi:MAG: MBL fold metallo-hydrolase [Gemmataceae bacterium]|nr:MBL fold metallo-hydrolase [Gemmataceae bacterium]
MQLTIFRGTREIGGNCVEMKTANTRIILDVGMPLMDETGAPFDSRTMRGKSIAQLLDAGTLPRVPGLFDKSAPPPDAILLSHAHLDHTGLVQYSRPTIPVFLSQGTSKMLMAGSIFAGQSGLERNRGRVFRSATPFRIGEFRITPYPVDHSAFDSMAFLIEADGKAVLYSGDLRLHGRKPGMARQLLQAVARQPVDVLIMEGTHMGSDRKRGITEHELEEEAVQQIRSANGLVLAMFSPMNVDRLVTFYKAAHRTKRVFVVDPYAAFVMHVVSGQCRIPPPTTQKGIRVYYNRHFERTYQKRNLKKVHGKFLADRISIEEILRERDRHLMVFRPSMLRLDFGDTFPEAARCLYSSWEGYLKSQEWDDFKEKLKAAGGDFLVCHASGHIFQDDLVRFVNDVNPRIVVPIHTMEPRRFGQHFRQVRFLKDGQAMNLTLAQEIEQ